jgi:hypothetical protein
MKAHDYINLMLYVILLYISIQYINNMKQDSIKENMDMGLFNADGMYSKFSLTKSDEDNKQKLSLENKEQELLIKNQRTNNTFNKFNYLKNRDNKVIYDRTIAPEKRIESSQYIYPEDQKFYIDTRGSPDEYQLYGVLFNESINKYLQLYGRRTYQGSPVWEYYIVTKDNGGMEIKFPLNNTQEIMDGSTIQNPLDNLEYKVKIYNFDKPRYNPYII